MHVMIFMCNAAHALACLVSFRANGLWQHVIDVLRACNEDVVAHDPWSGFSSSD